MTAAIEDIAFQVPIVQGELVEINARVVKVGRTSMRIRVEVSKENPITATSELCVVGHFTMVAMGPDRTPSRSPRAGAARRDLTRAVSPGRSHSWHGAPVAPRSM